ncbi:MAG: transcriptional repressor, partial [Prevotella histicola]|nr:transcriptional repressor [Prevotella histicola]
MEREEMDEAQIEQLLKAHGVKLTANRIVIIRTLAKQNNPVSM